MQGFASLGNGVTGGADVGAGSYHLVAKTGADIVEALKTKKNNPTPLTIYVNGTITPGNSGVNQFDVKDMDNVSIIGVGNAALFDGIGINIVRANNIAVRNLTMRYVRIGQKDAISIQSGGSNIWIDHNELYNSLDVNKDYYDELVSGKNGIDNVTLSYNYLHDSWKTSLWGSGDSDNHDRHISFIGNRWENVNSRLPLFRFGRGHVVNNYYKDVQGTAINSRMGAHVRVENNYFENTKNPLISQDSNEIGFWNPSGNLLLNVEWGAFPSGNCTSSKDCVWGGQPATTQNGGEFTAISKSLGAIALSDYEPPYAMPFLLDAADVKEHVLSNAGVNKVSRDCLGVPEEIVEGETGGSDPGDGEPGDGGDSGSAEGGWTLDAMMMGGSTSAISGAVSSSSESAVSFNIQGGKFESSKESFYYISQMVDGDFELSANLSNWSNPTRSSSDQGSVGLLLCVECENGGAMAASVKVGVRDSGIIHTQRLSAGGSLVKDSTGNGAAPGELLYLKLARTGDSFTLAYSTDGGADYQEVRTGSFPEGLPDNVQVGIYAAQGENAANGFTFQNIGLATSGTD